MRRTGSVLAFLLAFAAFAALTTEDIRQPAMPTVAVVGVVEPSPEAAADAPEQPPPLREVKCRPGFGHGISYRLDGERHCFKT
jgi:hypothetical protein